MSQEQVERLFVRFKQASNIDLSDIRSQRRGQKGTGLGLSIVKMLAERMGGTCGMNSKPGEGSQTWFTVKLAKAPDDSPRGGVILRRNHAPCKVLVSHRLPSVGLVLCRYLADWGYEATLVTSAGDVIALFEGGSNKALSPGESDKAGSPGGGDNALSPEGGRKPQAAPFGVIILDGSLLASGGHVLTELLVSTKVGLVLMTNPGITRLEPEVELLDPIICRKPVRYVPFFEAVSAAHKQVGTAAAGGPKPVLDRSTSTSWNMFGAAGTNFGGIVAGADETPRAEHPEPGGAPGHDDHLPDPEVVDFSEPPRPAPERNEGADQLPGSVPDPASPPGGAVQGDDEPPPERRRYVLVVEDHMVNQRIVCSILKKLDADVEVANNGLEAVAAAEKGAFDVILMDCQVGGRFPPSVGHADGRDVPFYFTGSWR